jgi:uncharacterized protein YbjT (DUF2867 family)
MAVTLDNSTLITIFGGSGFIGRYVVRALARTGALIRVGVRRPSLAGHLQLLGDVGQIAVFQADVREPNSVRRVVDGADAVVNLPGVLFESGRQTFRAVQAEGARHVAEAAREFGARALAHVSAIGADRNSRSAYARAKAEGERAVVEAFPAAVILRPSVVFGPEDKVFNRFASLARYTPVLPLIGGGGARFQPVYVGDVALAAVAALDGRGAPGAVYELGGPEIFTFREMLDFIAGCTLRKRPYISVPFWLAKLEALVLGLLPNPPLTVDQVRLLQTDNVVSEEAIRERRTLQGLGVRPQAVGVVAPQYLARFRRESAVVEVWGGDKVWRTR